MNEENIVKIKVPHTRFWVLGEKKNNGLWNAWLIEPPSDRKTILKENVSTTSFAIFSNVTLKTPFPYERK